MGKAKMIGRFRPFLANSRADERRAKLHRRNREYTTRHEEIVAAKREALQIREVEETKRAN